MSAADARELAPARRGVVVGALLLLAGVVGALLRRWRVTLAACALMWLNHQSNTGGPAYAPPGSGTMVGRPASPVPEGRPRLGAMIAARAAVKAEVAPTIGSRVADSGDGRAVGHVSLRNPSAHVTLVVSSVWCMAKSPTDSTSETARVSRRLPPGGSFEHSFRFERPYTTRGDVFHGRCEVHYAVDLP